MKKIISVLILLSMLLGMLASCSGGEKEAEVDKIYFDEDEITISVGETFKLEATIFPRDARDAKLEWESSNRDVATVSKGRVKGVSEGTAIISASSENGEYATCKVKVVSNIPSTYFEVLPGAKDFTDVVIENYSGIPSSVQEVKKETSGKGYVIKVSATGFSSEMIILVGISSEGFVTGAKCIVSYETNNKNIEETYGESFIGKDFDGARDVDLISGSTSTTKGYRDAVVDAIITATILGGGSVDTRTEEEKFRDALSAALPAGNGNFTKIFIFEFIPTVIDSIYAADNGAGYVCVIGDNSKGEFIGIGKDGKVINPKGTHNESNAEIAIARLTSSELNDIDITAYKNHTDKNIKSVYENINYIKKTSSGGYVIEALASGFSSANIVIRVAISSNGRIIDAQTVSHSETLSIGGIQLNDGEYNSCFIGLGQSQSEMVDTVAGATITTSAFKKAILNVFNAINILEDENIDFRTEEEKFRDALEAALPEANGEFTKYFRVESIEGFDTIYVADNNTGYVCVIGTDSTGTFIGVDSKGSVIGEVSYENKILAENAVSIISSTVLESIDFTEFQSHSDRNVKIAFRSISNIQKTATGNYVIEISMAGYGAEKMVIRVAISADGEVLDAQTVSHSETPTIGGTQLEDGAFNAEFIGKNETEADEVDTVAGVTVTTSAYKEAILRAFLAVNVLKENAPKNEYTLGMGTVVSLESSKTGTAQVDATVATVVLDKDGKIVFCRIDVAQNKVNIADGFVNIPAEFKTKQELLYDYNMSKWGSDNNHDGIVLEWFEQAKLFEEYVIGMTVEEVQNLSVQFVNDHYISADDELLTAGCTMQITDFRDAIVKACNDDQAVKFECEGEFTLGLAINSYNDGSKDAEEADGAVQVYSDIAAAVVADGKIIATLNDAIQPKIGFDWEGNITTKTFSGTKRELKENYYMAAYGFDNNGDGIVLEWYLQSATFSKYVVGLTADEVANLPTQVKDYGYVISADEDLLSAGCTIQITGMKDVVAKAAYFAR